MNTGGGRPGQGWRWAALAAGFVVVSSMGVAWLSDRDSFGRYGEIADMISAAMAVASLVVAVYAARQAAQVGAAQPAQGSPLTALAEQLADEVERQWREEERLRHLHDPWPLTIRFGPTARPVMDDWRVIRGDRSDSTPIDLSGQLDELAGAFARIPSRRLVLLGSSGAGKTATAIRFVTASLARRHPGDPVPVLLAASSWNPLRRTFPDWLDQTLRQRYPILAAQPELTRQLIGGGRLLVLIDGLDEIAERWRGAAIRELNRTVPLGHGLIVTCRGDEYERAVAASDVLTGAAAVELRPVDAADAIDYLSVATPPARRARWQRVIAELHRNPGGSLGEALSSPLFVSLARLRYADGTADPAELLERPRFGSAAVLERFLIDTFAEVSLRRTSRSAVDKPRRWLAFLAGHMRELNTSEFAWWELAAAVPRLFIGLFIAVPAGLVVAVSLAAWGMVYRPGAVGPTAGIVIGLIVVFLAACSAMPPARTTGTRLNPSVPATPADPWPVAARIAVAFAAVATIGWVLPGAGARHVVVITVITCVLLATAALTCPPGQALRDLSPPAWGACLAVLSGLGLGAVTVLAAPVTLDLSGLHPIFFDSAFYEPGDMLAVAVVTAILGAAVATGFALTEAGIIVSGQEADRWFARWIRDDNVHLRFLALVGFGLCMCGFLSISLAPAALFVVLIGLGLGSIAADNAARPRQPFGLRFRASRALRVIGSRLSQGISVGLVAGVALEITIDIMSGVSDFVSSVVSQPPPDRMANVSQPALVDPSTVLGAIGLGMMIGLMVGIAEWVRSSVDPRTVVSPADMIRADRRAVLAALLLAGGTGSIFGAMCIVSATRSDLVYPLAEGIVGGFLGATMMGLPVVLRVARTTAWVQYRASHLWLAATGRLPWRLMRFLDAAHAEGILWRNGGVYQFRHVRIQEALRSGQATTGGPS
ncbi:MAG TPA: NACHT domain-containing protein [Candidatus Limnocylindrales bacterium]